jgi:hypothetical protein
VNDLIDREIPVRDGQAGIGFEAQVSMRCYLIFAKNG